MTERARNWLLITCFLLLAVEGNPQNSSGLPNIAIPIYLVNGISADITMGLQTLGGPFAIDSASDSATTILVNDQYRISIGQDTGSSHTILHVQLEGLSGQAVQLNEIALQLRFARRNVDGVWSPAMPANQAQIIGAASDVPV